jgi:hypothetical protein
MCPRETVDHGRHRAWRNRCQCQPSGYKNLFWVRREKPDGAAYRQRRSWYPRSIYVGTLVVAAIACGFALGNEPETRWPAELQVIGKETQQHRGHGEMNVGYNRDVRGRVSDEARVFAEVNHESI